MVTSGLLVVLCPVKDVLNCATIVIGVQSAMTVGMILMLELLVDRLDSLSQVITLMANPSGDFREFKSGESCIPGLPSFWKNHKLGDVMMM